MSPPNQTLKSESGEPKRVLLATDLLFWRASTGAQQRVASLVRFLQSNGLIVKTFFLAPNSMSTFGLDAEDREMIKKRNLDVEIRSSDQVPQRFWSKLRWYISATKNQFFPATTPIEGATPPEQPATSLEDYRWPWAIEAFGDAVETFRPDAIICEYIKLAYLLEGLTRSQRSSTLCLVDTHDVLHLRNEAFQQRGETHWLDIDRAEEAKAISKFDIAIAIQAHEANLFREMVPDMRVITCGHSTDTRRHEPTRVEFESNRSQELESDLDSSSPLRVGFLASHNAANLDALKCLLTNLWPLVIERLGNEVQLIVAGSICDAIGTQQREKLQTSLKLLGHVAELPTFYDAVDLVVNPISFGTGLKIKNVEALSFGKPVLTTSHGAQGMPEELLDSDREGETPPLQIFDSPASFLELVEPLLDRSTLRRVSLQAMAFERTVLSEQSIYSELAKVLSEIH